MEHRLSARVPFNSSVAIYYNSLGLLQGQAVDLSRHGMFVRTHMVLPLHALVEIAFPSQKTNVPANLTPAMVVRVADNGVGLMFGGEVEPAHSNHKTTLESRDSNPPRRERARLNSKSDHNKRAKPRSF